jgi:hypothetical protein
MEASEIQARATIAAALITAHAVEVPTIAKDLRQKDAASRRLRELTDYVYDAITASRT